MKKKEIVFKRIDALIREGKNISDLSMLELINSKSLQNISASTIRRSFNEYLKNAKNPKKSIREEIFDYLAKKPDCTLSKVIIHFSAYNKNTITNYFYSWQKNEKSASPRSSDITEKKDQLKNNVFLFLDKNPNANLADLKKTFPYIDKKLISYFRNWKYQRKDKIANQAKIAESGIAYNLLKEKERKKIA